MARFRALWWAAELACFPGQAVPEPQYTWEGRTIRMVEQGGAE